VSTDKIVREEGYFYFLDKEGYICRAAMRSNALRALNEELKVTDAKLTELLPKRKQLSRELGEMTSEINTKSRLLEEMNGTITISEVRASELRAEVSKEEARVAHLDQERQRIIQQKTSKEQQLKDLDSELKR
jgi:chromosome segregation ATPase